MSKILEVIEEKIAASEKHSHCMMSGTTLLNEVNARLRVNGETEIGEDQFKEELKGLLKEQKIFFKKEYDEKIKYDGTYERVELKARSWFLNNAKLKEHEEKTVAYNKESREREEQKLVQKDRDVKKLSREAQAVYGTIKALTVEDNKAYVKTSEVQKKANMEFKEVQDAIKELRDNKISYMMKISRDFEKDTNGVKDNVHEEDWVITNSSKVLSKVIEREKIKEELNTAKNNDKEIKEAENMPFVRIDLFEGRTLEQKKALAKEVTEAVVRNTGAPQSAVHVIINDMPEGTYFPQGQMREK